ncbi:MAG TPA: DUF819 family protein [Thermoanaerobaculia bacterium]|nr:DUF819 family protein [Thermoanaerobaculia bacterium]
MMTEVETALETAETALITSDVGVLATLVGVAAFFFWLERATRWKLFQYIVPLIWIYATPVVLRNTGILPADSGVYDVLRSIGLPVVIVLLLVDVDVGAAVRIMGKGVGVMLIGTAGIVIGAPIGYFVVHGWLEPDAWKGFAALSGSWIGGTGNMAAVSEGVGASPEQFGLAVLADTVIYVAWLPLLLASKNFAERFNKWTGVEEGRLEKIEAAAAAEATEEGKIQMVHYLFLGALALLVTWGAVVAAPLLPETAITSTGTWLILLITAAGIALSFTPAKSVPGSHNLAMAVLYVFVARMGATASLEGLAQAPAFLLGTAIWIMVHGVFVLGAAYLLKVDVHSAAIASAANVGGAASAPVVAAFHRESLVPVSILMALIGYAIGNPLGLLVVAPLCRWVGGG